MEYIKPQLWSKTINSDSKFITARTPKLKPLNFLNGIDETYPTVTAPPVLSIEALDKQYDIARALHEAFPSRKMAPREWILTRKNQKARLFYDPRKRQMYFVGESVNPETGSFQMLRFYSDK